jgi:hypothetical protein
MTGLKQLRYNSELQLFSIQLGADTTGSRVIHIAFYYCPECGKRIAPLQPEELICRSEEVSEAETERLAKLAEGFETYDDVFSKFGRPDCEIRSVRYDSLCPSASLSFYTGTGEKVKFFITPNWNRVKKGQQIAAPNGGRANALGSAGVCGGPPSVS